MAERPVFLPAPGEPGFVRVAWFQFKWHPGLSVTQKKKNVISLHQAAAASGYSPILEVSTKSEDALGRHLSAFYLTVRSGDSAIPLESAFQGSKVFEGGGPFTDIYRMNPRDAKKDVRVRSSGRIVAFDFLGTKFPITPRTVFYDWLYICSLFDHREFLRVHLRRFAGFTDIEFNPQRSINCQARSCALFVALINANLLKEAVASPRSFLELFQEHGNSQRARDLLP